MTSFRVKRNQSPNVSLVSQPCFNQSEQKTGKKSISEFQKFMNQAKIKLSLIKGNKQQTSKFKNYGLISNANISCVSLEDPQNQDKDLLVSRKTTISYNMSKDRQKLGKKQNKMSIQYLIKNRRKMISKYEQLRKKRKQQNDNGFQNVQDFRLDVQSSQKLFLCNVEKMKIQKSLQQFHPHKIDKTKRQSKSQRRNRGKYLSEAVQKLEQLQNAEPPSKYFAETKQTKKSIRLNTHEKQLQTSIYRVNQNLSKTSNRIYGRNHNQLTFGWCSSVLINQIQQEFPYIAQQEPARKHKKQRLNKSTINRSDTIQLKPNFSNLQFGCN